MPCSITGDSILYIVVDMHASQLEIAGAERISIKDIIGVCSVYRQIATATAFALGDSGLDISACPPFAAVSHTWIWIFEFTVVHSQRGVRVCRPSCG